MHNFIEKRYGKKIVFKQLSPKQSWLKKRLGMGVEAIMTKFVAYFESKLDSNLKLR